MKHTFMTFVLFLAATMAFGQADRSREIDFARRTLASRGEFYFSFVATDIDPAIRPQLARLLSVDRVCGDTVFAYCNATSFETFLGYNIDFQRVSQYYNRRKSLDMAHTVAEMSDWDRYPTHAVYVAMMRNMAAAHSSICRLDTIGFSVERRPVLNMIISDNVDTDEDEPEFWWSSTIHGDEPAGWYFMLRLIDYLLTNYNHDAQVTNLVDNIKLYITPLANPDGTFHGSPDGTNIADATRYNANDVDLNRNFPCIDGTPGADEPEVTMMTDYAAAHDFVMSINGHGGDELFNYPWDEPGWSRSEHPHADDNWWQHVGQLYAHNAQDDSPAGYFTGMDTGVTEGCDWYGISGGRQDYMNYFHHCREATIEWSERKMLDTRDLNDYWGYNKQAILKYTEQVLYGLRGVVVDSCTRTPLDNVKVIINGHDTDNSEVYTSAPVGNYHRPIFAGTYNVTFSKDGYLPVTKAVTIQNDHSTRLDVALVPGNIATPDFYASNTQLTVNQGVSFTNSTVGECTSYQWTFEGGNPNVSNEQNPTDVTYSESGSYDVSLTIVSQGCELTKTKPDYITVVGQSSDIQDVTTDVAVFPNPVADLVSISAAANMRRISIVAANGQVVDEIYPNATNFNYDVTRLVSGSYTIIVETDARISTKNIIIVK